MYFKVCVAWFVHGINLKAILILLLRLQTVQKAILQSQLSVRDVRQAILCKVESDIKSTSQVCIKVWAQISR